MCNNCIKWNKKELEDIESRILQLSDKQIVNLFKNVGISYKTPMTKIVAEMRESKWSIPMDVLTSEARSKEELLKWINTFEKQNKPEIKRN